MAGLKYSKELIFLKASSPDHSPEDSWSVRKISCSVFCSSGISLKMSKYISSCGGW
ncbi:unnamed protein product [Moneuplotes crassus]|uniref:Uncharacterized protein n=1 Tax=Euplotes crassus TaxID=5936 RepID=A0AAD1ULJ3_EUPCR|nr:unnamed protein product [Moneuplotes crassus]